MTELFFARRSGKVIQNNEHARVVFSSVYQRYIKSIIKKETHDPLIELVKKGFDILEPQNYYKAFKEHLPIYHSKRTPLKITIFVDNAVECELNVSTYDILTIDILRDLITANPLMKDIPLMEIQLYFQINFTYVKLPQQNLNVLVVRCYSLHSI